MITSFLNNNDKNMINELYMISLFTLAKYNTITKKAKKFNIPIIEFINIKYDLELEPQKIEKNNLHNQKRLKQIEYFTANNKNYKAITFINKTHFPHHIEESKNIILDIIKNESNIIK